MEKEKKKTSQNDSLEIKEGAWAAAGFALVLIIVGIPVWWTTTTVYRASLPYSTIRELAQKPTYQTVHLNVIGDVHSTFVQNLKQYLNDGDMMKFLLSGHLPTKEEGKILSSNLTLEEKEIKLRKNSIYHSGTLYLFVTSQNYENEAIFVGNGRLLVTSINADFKLLSKTLNKMSLDPLASELLAQKSHRLLGKKQLPQKNSLLRQVPTEPGYDITLTLMLPQPQILRARWDVKKAIEDYLQPLVLQLKEVLDLRVRSQILYMASLKVTPKWSAEYKHFALPHQQLPLTINAIEAKLGSFVSTRPSLHFIIYVPMEHQIPLVIHTKDNIPLESNSFLVPRWGGVLIHNPPKKEEVGESSPLNSTFEFNLDSHWVMSTVITQLHKLFPIPHLKNSSISQEKEFLFADWQIDALARARILMYLNNIKITLQSLGDLVGEISNMVISDEVAGWVSAAVDDWSYCLDAGREGRLMDATDACRDAFAYSDDAFFHPSMLALLYFPDNQKYAIYVPLFLPVSIPVVLSFRMVFKFFLSSRDKKAE